jgi:hypothetical protein
MGELELGSQAMKSGFRAHSRHCWRFLQPYSSRRIFLFAQAMMVLLQGI